MNDIRQITNFDLEEVVEETRTIHKGDGSGETISYPYKRITSDLLGSDNIFKLGYCANDIRGINYPIFLTINGTEREYQLGKTGMFEFQPEVYKDINESEEEFTAKVSLSEVLVPSGIAFHIDYCYSI